MVVRPLSAGQLIGLSSDTKPTTPSGYTFYESDTGDIFIFDGTFWWLRGIPSPLSTKRYGLFYGTSSAGSSGMFDGGFSTVGTANGVTMDATNGSFSSWTSAATAGTRAGTKFANNYSTRGLGVMLKVQFQISTGATNNRAYIGLKTTPLTELTGDDPLNAINGIIVGQVQANVSNVGNFHIIHNDGSGGSNYVDLSVAVDTAIHTVIIVADDANSRFAVKLDNGVYNMISTEIPAPSTALGFQSILETSEAVAHTFRLYNVYATSNK